MDSFQLPNTDAGRFGNLRRALRGQYRLSFLAVLILLGGVWFRDIVRELLIADRKISLIVIGFVITGCATLTAFILARIFLALGDRYLDRKIICTLIAYLIVAVGLVSGRSISPLVNSFDVSAEVVRVFLAAGYLGVLAYCLDALHEYRSSIESLTKEQMRLELLRNKGLESIRQDRTALNELVDQRIGPELDRLLGDVSRLESATQSVKAPQIQSVAALARTIADSEVRPLSHELDRANAASGSLASPLDGLETESISSPKPQKDWHLSIIKSFPGEKPYRPLGVSITFLLAVVSSSTINGRFDSRLILPPWALLFVALCGAVLIACWYEVLARIWKSLQQQIKNPWAATIVSLSFILTGTGIAAITFLSTSTILGFQARPAFMGVGLGVVVCSLIWVVVGLVTEQAHRTEQSLRETVQATEWEKRRAEEEAVELRRAVSAALHGDIQNKLALNAMMLDDLAEEIRSGSSTADRDLSKLSVVATNLRKVATTLDEVASHAKESRDLGESLDDVRRSWAGVAEVSWTSSRAAVDACHAQPLLSEAVAQVFREAVANAIRHGRADRITGTVNIEENLLSLEIRDNGSYNTEQSDGLGFAIYDRLAMNWNVASDKSGTVFKSHFPLISPRHASSFYGMVQQA